MIGRAPNLRLCLVSAATGWLAAGMALAQDGGMAACVADSYDPGDCVGVISRACQAAGDGTTLSIVDCAREETEAWDAMLNAEYQATMQMFREADASGDVGPGGLREEALRKAQRAWIAFRDAECSLAYAEWGTGSMRHVEAAQCLMEETAERAIELRQMREP